MAISPGGFVVKKIKYEKPILYGLDRGSLDADGMGCSNGSTYLSDCVGNGTNADVRCKSGTWTGGPCGTGNMTSVFNPICTVGAGNTTGCGTGSSAAGGCWPTGNST